jgi:predicted membrane-bound spermidine synthase
MPGLKKDKLAFAATQCAVCIYPLILPIILWMLAGSGSKAILWLGSNVVFILLPAISGFIGGFQFPLANKIYLGKREEVGRIAGLSYGVDLFGSCLGALLTGAVLVPVLGIPKTCLAISLVSFAVLLAMAFQKKSI